jgi:hypothetical protein
VKIILPIFLILACVNFCNAQAVSSGKYKKSVFVEFAGNGIGASGNFDIRLKPDSNNGFGLRAGAGIIGTFISLPFGFNYIVGKKKSGFESGIGITTLYNFNPGYQGNITLYKVDSNTKLITMALLSFGYRFQATNGLMLSAKLSALHYKKYYTPRPWPGLSIGYSFK